MDVQIEKSWKEKLASEFDKPYFHDLVKFLKSEYQLHSVLPEGAEIFNAFSACPFDKVKVVILGQDPYPTKGHAHGLCFSVQPDVNPLPKSLNNIYKELNSDIENFNRPNGNLLDWAKQGVLLLNTVLTVREGEAGSHSGKGWEIFTDAVIQALSNKEGIVYILWGSKAQQKAYNVDSTNNLILKAPHPSPLSAYRGFFGCKHFSKTNDYLQQRLGITIKW